MDHPTPQAAAGESLPAQKWVWKLLTGDAYPYIRRSLQQEKGAPPSAGEVRQKFVDVYTHSTVKIMVMELVGIVLEFQDLSTHPYGSTDFTNLTADPIGYLSREYGGGKFKISFYYGDQFVATQNFKVSGRPTWNMNKCLTSLADAMAKKTGDDASPAFDQLIQQLCSKLKVSGTGGKVDTATFLTLVRLTAGSQYEDYFSILHNCPDPQPLTDHLMDALAAIHRTRHPQP